MKVIGPECGIASPEVKMISPGVKVFGPECGIASPIGKMISPEQKTLGPEVRRPSTVNENRYFYVFLIEEDFLFWRCIILNFFIYGFKN
jgi:hypothetical protein